MQDDLALAKLYLHKNNQAVKKRCGPCQKRQHEKSCEIKGGGPEVVVMVG